MRQHTQRVVIYYLEHAKDGGDIWDGGVISPEVGVDVLRKAEPDGLLSSALGKDHVMYLADEYLVEGGGRGGNDRE